MEIKIGQIINAYHIDDNEKRMLHPFLIINITKNNIFAIQCSSVKQEDNESYFSRNGRSYYELEYSDMEYVTHVSTDTFEKIDNNDIKEVLCEPSLLDYNDIAQELLNVEWENGMYFNSNQIHDQIRKGITQFGNTWTIDV